METILYLLLVVGVFSIPVILNYKNKEKKLVYNVDPFFDAPEEVRDFHWLLEAYRQNTTNLMFLTIEIDSYSSQIAKEHCEFLMELDEVTEENGHKNFPDRSLKLIEKGALSVAEIVTMSNSVTGLLDKFLGSPDHKAVIDNPRYNAIGIGITYKPSIYYATIIFFEV